MSFWENKLLQWHLPAAAGTECFTQTLPNKHTGPKSLFGRIDIENCDEKKEDRRQKEDDK